MAGNTAAALPHMDVALDIGATPRTLLHAFFDAATLASWCGTVRSVTTPRLLGVYALEWPTVDDRDDVLGRLGGVLRGTVMQFEATRGFFLADVYWLPPDSGPIGPMAMEVGCTLGLSATGRPTTRVRLSQSGFEESARWRRYYDVAGAGWLNALETLKRQLESGEIARRIRQ